MSLLRFDPIPDRCQCRDRETDDSYAEDSDIEGDRGGLVEPARWMAALSSRGLAETVSLTAMAVASKFPAG
ncbi:MAG: hypothetical protein HOK71_09625 [Planctomycetaceae bacterium]|jgi:hypothetical protein|nr:hypothetical protein [Planctomycetaceae bacterium]MBT6484919.1 hypothetical protein [Planctomycetaceae bacterium]